MSLLQDVALIGNGDLISATANYLQILNTFYSRQNLNKNDLDLSLDRHTLKLIETTNKQTEDLLNEFNSSEINNSLKLIYYFRK